MVPFSPISAHYVLSSVTRIAPFQPGAFEVEALPRRDWEGGDYVVGQVLGVSGPLRHIELASGRMAEIDTGDLVVGALGQRAATLEACGDWQAVGADLLMHALTSAGLFGRETSKSPYVPELISLVYRGHVVLDGRRQRMDDYSVRPLGCAFELPVVLVIGTSMSAGKTTACRVIVRELRSAGLRVAGAKLTGAARYRDVLAMLDAGADHVFDFVDAGLPSTVCDEIRFRGALAPLLEHIGNSGADVLVAEAGASPLEAYNGATAIRMLAPHVRCTVLCASDPYAVVGVVRAFECPPDLVAGGAANTEAGVELVARLTGLEALNLLNETSRPRLRTLLHARLDYRSAGP
jgi:Domain of unknown function (DUF1611_C) P-loop domain